MYLYNNNIVGISSHFIYEATIYQLTPGTAVLLETKYFRSEKLLKISKETEIKRFSNFIIIKYINIIAVPIDFANDYKLKEI